MGLHNFTPKKWLNKYGLIQNNSYFRDVEVFHIRCDWMFRSANGEKDYKDKRDYSNALKSATDGIARSELFETLVKFAWTEDQTKIMILRVIPSILLLIFSVIYYTYYLHNDQQTWDEDLVANVFAVLVVWDVIWR